MKKGIHPASHKIKLILTNGNVIEVESTYGKPGTEMRLDIDPLKHPAWNKGANIVNENAGKVASFKAKFGALDFMAVPAAKKEEKKDATDAA
jgi:large subunit ribosomal protein L31